MHLSNKKDCLTTFSNLESKVENTVHSGVFLINFDVFSNIVNRVLIA